MSQAHFLAKGPAYASGMRIVAEALRAILPPAPANVADFAAAKRWLANEGGGYVGLWNHHEAPYLIRPMESLSKEQYSCTAVAGPGQCGKTEIGRNWLFTTALADPADMLWYSGSEPLVTTESKVNIARMINDHAQLKEMLNGNSISMKKFGTMVIEFLAGIESNMISKSVPRIVADEWDMIWAALPNVKELLDLRMQTYGHAAHLLALSHPDAVEGLEPDDWTGGIMKLYRDSTRGLWYWPCPHCGAHSSPNPTAARYMPIHYDDRAPLDEIRDMARLLCPVNGCLIEDSQRYSMNLHGDWVFRGQTIDEDGTIAGEPIAREIDGYWIVGAMSKFTKGGIGALAVTEAQAQRDYERDNDRKAFRSTIAKRLGLPLRKDKRTDSIDANTLAARAEPGLKLGQVPHGVRCIMVMIDVQGGRFEALARGFFSEGRSVVVDFRAFEGNPGTSEEDWDQVLKYATETHWPLEGDLSRGMRAHMVGYDSAGVPGVTTQAYAAWRRLKAAQKVRLHGRINGLPAWNVMPTKGGSTLSAPRLQVVFPENNRKDRSAGAVGDVPVALFNPNLFKDDLADQLAQEVDARWSIRFPKELANEQPPHPWFEQVVAEQRDKRGKWDRKKAGAPNEATDLLVGTDMLACLAGYRRIKWDAPPQWAKPWNENSNVAPIKLVELVEGIKVVSQTVANGPSPVMTAKRTGLRIIDSIKVRR